MATSIQQPQDECTLDPKKARNNSTWEFKLEQLGLLTLGCWRRPNQEESNGIEARDTHTKEDRIFRAGKLASYESNLL